jgi:hypothetical protein
MLLIYSLAFAVILATVFYVPAVSRRRQMRAQLSVQDPAEAANIERALAYIKATYGVEQYEQF